MDEYNVLKLKENVGGVNISVRANVALKISAKTTANANNDDTIVKIRKSLSLRKDKLAEILNSKTFQPLFIDSNGPSTAIGTSSNICDDDERGDENTQPNTVQPHSNNEGNDFDIISVLFSCGLTSVLDVIPSHYAQKVFSFSQKIVIIFCCIELKSVKLKL